MMQDYKQIARDGSCELVIRHSQFICHLKRVETEEEAQTFIAQVKKEHKKATHNCSAYLIGESDHIQRAHDDGEPSGTAGVPILNVLKKNDLHFIVAVVTRYFGGIKLGAGGLIRAYGSAVSNALNELGLIMHTLEVTVHMTFDYSSIGKTDYFLSQHPQYRLLDTLYAEKVTYVCGVVKKQVGPFMEEMNDLFMGNAILDIVSEQYIDLPLEKELLDLSDERFDG